MIEKKDTPDKELNTSLITELTSPVQKESEYIINLHGEKVKPDEDDYEEFTPIKVG